MEMGMEALDRLMADFAGIEPIFSQGISAVLNVGQDVAIYYWKWGASLHDGSVCPVPAAIVIRPRATLWTAQKLLDGARHALGMAH